MNVVDLNQRLHYLQQQNERLRQAFSTSRNSQSLRANGIDFETKYKKALKEIYEVIQANKSLKDELQKFKTSRSRVDSGLNDMRKEEIYKAYENVLGEKNELNERLNNIQQQNEHYHMQLQSLSAENNILKEEKLYLIQEKQALESKLSMGSEGVQGEQLQEVKVRLREKEVQLHQTIENYEQHHINLSNQNKKNEERLSQMEEKLMANDKQWRNRYQAKEIEFTQMRNNVRHEYQEQINILRKEINSLKLLNTQLMTKLQTIQLEGHTQQNEMTQYEIQMLNSIKELRLQMEPLKRQVLQLQEQNIFDKELLEREKTQLQLKLYQHQSTIQHQTILIKNHQDKILKLNQLNQKHSNNQTIIKKLEEENKILGGRVIVLESKDIAIENRKDHGYKKLQENVLQFQTRVEMLLNQKQNLSNSKNITIHQLVTLKTYIAELDQKLKYAYQQNQYATKKYKSYKEKYLNTIKEVKNQQLLNNTLKSKILGYDKLVQRLQSELQKNVNISQMQVIQMTTKTSQQQIQIQTFKKKYQSLKEKLILQEKYNKQQLETIRLNYETKIVDLSIKVQQLSSLRQAIQLYKDKNEQLQSSLSQKENQLLQLRVSNTKQSLVKNQTESTNINTNREFILSLQETIRKQENHIGKIQAELRIQQDSSRKRIQALQKQLHQTQGEFSKVKLSSSTKYSSQKSAEEILVQNKRLKNKISELQSQIILTKGTVSQDSYKNTYQLQFKLSNYQIQKNQLANKLQTQLSHKKRLQKQLNDLINKNNQLEASVIQLNLQNSRKLQQLTFQLNEKQSIINTLEQQVKRLKSQQRTTLQSSVVVSPNIQIKEDVSFYENKINRLEREIETLQLDNDQLRRRVSQMTVGSSVSFNYEVESLKHEKEELRLKVQRVEKEVNSNRATINTLQEEKYQLNRAINSLKQELSSVRLSHQDQMFDKQRVISQLRTKVQHSESVQSNYVQMQTQLEDKLSEKQRQITQLKSKLNSAESDIQRMNDAINKYNRDINMLKFNQETAYNQYKEQTDSLLQEKSRTFKKYEEQIAILNLQLDTLTQQLSSKTQTLLKTQRELTELKLLEDQITAVKSSLSDRENTISRNRYELSTYEQENERLKRETSTLKQQIQRQRLQLLNKQDQISSIRLDLSTLSNRLSNQIRNEFIQQISEKQLQISKMTFQLQSLQNNYNNIQAELNQTEAKERKSQQQLILVKGQLSRCEEEMSEISQRLIRKESQLNQVTGEITGLKYLEQEINDKNNTINKLRSQLSSIKLDLSQLTEQTEFKESTIVRQNNQLKSLRQQLLNKDQTVTIKQNELRLLTIQTQRLKSTLEENEMLIQQKDGSIAKLNTQLTKARQELRDSEQQIEQREQEWSNIQYEMNQAKSQINLISDQLQAKDIGIAKLSNQCAFLKQEITRLNQELIEKSHQVNRVSQQVFVQKMQYTNKTSEEVQTLSNEIFTLKRQIESTKHNLQDLQVENRRLKIQIQGSRVRYQQNSQMYIYSEEDFRQLREQNNNKYRQIMELQLQVSQRNAQINQKNDQITLLNQKISKLQHLLTQLQEESQYNKQHLESQIQQFIQHERELRNKIQTLQSNTYIQSTNEQEPQNTEQLKFGLKLYTEQTDRLQKIINELTQQVVSLKLKLSAYVNQEDRIEENLVTMVMTFAEVQALRDRMKVKQEQINSVRRSFIQAISSNQDVHSQYKFHSSNLIKKQDKQSVQYERIQNFDVQSQKSPSIINYQSEKGIIQPTYQQIVKNEYPVKENRDYEVRSDEGSQQLPDMEGKLAQVHSMKGQIIYVQDQMQITRQSQHLQTLTYESQPKPIEQKAVLQEVTQSQQQQIKIPEPIQFHEHQSSHQMQELNRLKEEENIAQEIVQQQHVTFRSNIIQQTVQSAQVTNFNQPAVRSHHQQRGRTINIVYQDSQAQQGHQRQRISQSQFQSPSGNTYVRITQQRTVTQSNSGPGVYIPQAMNIQPVRQSGASFSSQSRPVNISFQNQPHNLRY